MSLYKIQSHCFDAKYRTADPFEAVLTIAIEYRRPVSLRWKVSRQSNYLALITMLVGYRITNCASLMTFVDASRSRDELRDGGMGARAEAPLEDSEVARQVRRKFGVEIADVYVGFPQTDAHILSEIEKATIKRKQAAQRLHHLTEEKQSHLTQIAQFLSYNLPEVTADQKLYAFAVHCFNEALQNADGDKKFFLGDQGLGFPALQRIADVVRDGKVIDMPRIGGSKNRAA
jgi:hypothetical protein